MANAGRRGAQVHRLPPAQLQKWREDSRVVYDEWLKDNAKSGANADMVKDFRALLDKYEAEVKAKGYPKISQ